jgi:hypothetical protein
MPDLDESATGAAVTQRENPKNQLRLLAHGDNRWDDDES